MFDSEGANCRHVDADRQNIQINIPIQEEY